MIACTKCGLCCRKAGSIPGFPEPVDEQGACIHLKADNSCCIYDTRPDICNSRTMYERHFSGMSEEAFIDLNATICAALQGEK